MYSIVFIVHILLQYQDVVLKLGMKFEEYSTLVKLQPNRLPCASDWKQVEIKKVADLITSITVKETTYTIVWEPASTAVSLYKLCNS